MGMRTREDLILEGGKFHGIVVCMPTKSKVNLPWHANLHADSLKIKIRRRGRFATKEDAKAWIEEGIKVIKQMDTIALEAQEDEQRIPIPQDAQFESGAGL